MIGYAVELYFDAEGEERIRRLWRGLATVGISDVLEKSGGRPHISLAVFGDVEVGRLQEVVEGFAQELPPLRVNLASVGTFPTPEGVVFLAPVVSRALLALHESFSERLAVHKLVAQPYYRAGRWVPHCTVGQSLASGQITAAVEFCRYADVYGRYDLVEMGMVEFRPVKQIVVGRLMGKPETAPV